MSKSPHNYKFYMQECNKYGIVLEDSVPKDLEVDFEGLKYSSMEGIETLGKPKNIYTEEYADTSRLRTFIPDAIYRESTSITFTCYIFGEQRFGIYDAFNRYISSGYHKYWDTARKKYFIFFVSSAISPSSGTWNGIGYLEVSYKLSNIYGQTFEISEELPKD